MPPQDAKFLAQSHVLDEHLLTIMHDQDDKLLLKMPRAAESKYQFNMIQGITINQFSPGGGMKLDIRLLISLARSGLGETQHIRLAMVGADSTEYNNYRG